MSLYYFCYNHPEYDGVDRPDAQYTETEFGNRRAVGCLGCWAAWMAHNPEESMKNRDLAHLLELLLDLVTDSLFQDRRAAWPRQLPGIDLSTAEYIKRNKDVIEQEEERRKKQAASSYRGHLD